MAVTGVATIFASVCGRWKGLQRFARARSDIERVCQQEAGDTTTVAALGAHWRCADAALALCIAERVLERHVQRVL